MIALIKSFGTKLENFIITLQTKKNWKNKNKNELDHLET